MRHGILSDTHSNYLSTSDPVNAGEARQCPFGHYGNAFTTKEPRRAIGAPRLPAVVGRMASTGADGMALAAAADPMEKPFGRIADARASGVDRLPDDKHGQTHGNIPAGYTYFGQLVVHDLTHSVAVDDHIGKPPAPGNLSTPVLDLDTIYGGGPARCPHLYQPPYLNAPPASNDPDQYLFYLGRTAPATFPENEGLKSGEPRDLPRIDTQSRGIADTEPPTSVTPLIHDERNDDNLILSQLVTQILLVHNKVASHLARNGDPTHGNSPLDRKASFELARHFVLKAYRRVVLHDYLRHLLFPSIHEDLLAGKMEAYKNLPVEFVFGVARAGHSMVRAAYDINRHLDLSRSSLGRLMAFSSSTPGARLPLPADWVVDWSRLLVMKDGDTPQFARRISPFLAPTFVNGDLRSRRTGLNGSLSFHDLWRCYQFGVPTGQECAEQLIGRSSPDFLQPADMLPTPTFIDLHPADNLIAALDKYHEFCEKTPLSYYILQEAAKIGGNGRFLGPVGSTIFARTILFALQNAPSPHDTPPGQSDLSFAEIRKETGILKLADLLKVSGMQGPELAATIVATLM
ncbi:MAG: peroxidase family protein [Dongiaceae bacterium]